MRPLAFLCAWLALSTPVLAGDGKSAPKPKKPPRPAGIWWEKDVATGLQRAMREGRPVLFAVNALENERANNRLASVDYRSAAWGEATRGYVAFVCNPNDHMAGGAKSCSRYPGHVCSGHRAALTWFTKRFGDNLISPQHVILEPDGDVAYRKEYYTGVVKPALLEAYLSKLAPRVAYSRAGIGREKKIAELGKRPIDETFEPHVVTWLRSGDGLAAAGVLNALDDSYDAPRRAALIRALRRTPALQVPVLIHAAEERVLYPGDEPAETRAWIATLFAADRASGVWAATRALVRMEDASERDAVLRLWAGTPADAPAPGIDDLPADERAYAYEALILAKDRRALATRVPAAWKAGRELEIARALRQADRTTSTPVDLGKVLSSATPPGTVRRSLLAADEAAVRKAADAVVMKLNHALSARVRIAAALALLKARLPQGGAVVRTILTALDDPLEGTETRAQALRVLGEDPGPDRAEWTRLMGERLKGGAK
ncbi:MAG: hypothetical protein QNJ90_11975 [Planctomycetota bacterium]|nr:hypothetical protein [Planctomycetota bacterium]